MRKMSGSALEALQSMGQGSLGVYGQEANLRPGTVTADTGLGQAGIVAGNWVASNPSRIQSWATGESRPVEQVAEALQARALAAPNAAAPLASYVPQ